MSVLREVKVGIFVLAGLAVLGIVIFLIGEERRAFASKETYTTSFKDVQGLRRGSPVRMGGVDIGSVAEVAYGGEASDRKIYVKMAIVEREARRIRSDSMASIEAKGLLGDKMIAISVGSISKPEVPPGGAIPSREGNDIGEMMSRLGTITSQVERVVTNLEQTTGTLANPELQHDIKQGVGALSRILVSVERGDGYVGRLFKDPQEADRISQAVHNLERASSGLDQATRSVNEILSRVQKGPGLAHEVLYGEPSSKAVAQFGGAAEEVGLTLKGIREGDGFARSLLFGGDPQAKEIVENLSDASEDLKAIASGLRSGRGTLGALLVDPSVYEDLKLVLGNVERNKALRALVRYSIRRDAPTPRVEDTDPPSSNGASVRPKLEGALEGASGPNLGE
jgi:phospholipid/cholesterol/gamma-HCH transport system substrate-binding protein